MKTHRRLRVAVPSASRARSRRGWGLTARALLGFALLFSSIAAARMPPQDVRVDVPVYEIRQPIECLDERWTYSFAWNGIPVGSATVTVAETGRNGSQDAVKIGVSGKTSSFVDLLWDYRMEASGDVRIGPFAPHEFISRERERGSEKLTRVAFDSARHVTSYRSKGGHVEQYGFAAPNTYDILSTVLLALNLDYRRGDILSFDTLTGTARYLVQVRVVEREPIEVAGVVRDAWRLEIVTTELTDPKVEPKHESTELWVSAERPRRLLRARSRTFVGSIYADLRTIERLEPAEEMNARARP
jgi:hypothetical protein